MKKEDINKATRRIQRIENYDIMTKGAVSRCLYCFTPSRFHIKFCDDMCKELLEEELGYKKEKTRKANKKMKK